MGLSVQGEPPGLHLLPAWVQRGTTAFDISDPKIAVILQGCGKMSP